MTTKLEQKLLRELREGRGLTQQQVADKMENQQENVARIEARGANLHIETLARYLAALGYTLELVVYDGDARMLVRL